MKIPEPYDYCGKRVRIHTVDGDYCTGTFFGYNYDYDDNGEIFLEFDIETEKGLYYGFAEDEVDHIEVVARSPHDG